MKKISLTKQLFFIYIIVLLITTFTFANILSNWIYNIYVDINYTKLDDFVYNIKLYVDNDIDLDTIEKNDIEFIIWNDLGVIVNNTDNALTIFDNDKEIQDILLREFRDETNIYHGHSEKGGNFFTMINIENYYILALSSDTSIDGLYRDTTSQIIILFFIILIGGGLIIAFWSNLLVQRITKITDHVQKMPIRNYGTSYLDNGIDEVSDLAYYIESMRIQIYDNEETKREMIQNLSHDIKTPLAVIKSYAEAIMDEVEEPKSAELIIKQSNLLQHKVEMLLQLNRLHYLEKDREFDSINLEEIINSIVGSLKHLTKLEFILNLEETYFLGYSENYYTIIENILSNAMRYAKSKIVITLKDNELSFYNDGEHIDEQFLNANFKAYEKGSRGEFGVGMSIVKKTLDFFSLELEVDNETIGVTFTIKRNADFKKNMK